MSIKYLMSNELVTVFESDTLSTVREIFELVTFHHILVLDDDGKLAGVVSDRDYFKAIGPRLGTPIETERDKMPLNKKVHQIMNRRVIKARETATTLDVVTCFQKFGVSCVPVVDEDNIPVGIISWRDVMNALASKMIKKQLSSH